MSTHTGNEQRPARMPNWYNWRFFAAFLSALFAISVVSHADTFPRHVQAAIAAVLESENMTLSGRNDARFVRYDSLGNVEQFDCPSMAAFNFHPFHSSQGGGIVVGACERGSQLDEKFAEQQAKRFELAVSVVGGATPKSPVDVMKPQVFQAEGMLFVHFTQWFLSGIGGARGHGAGTSETLLMIPPNSKIVILVQGGLSYDACPPQNNLPSLPLCADFRAAMRDVARRVYVAQAASAPSPAFKLEPLRPGTPTVCDSTAYIVAQALEQSDANRIPVTETTRYKQLEGQTEIQRAMRAAANEHIQGASITDAATRVGRECFQKSFGKQ